jgi:hypothetical protein
MSDLSQKQGIRYNHTIHANGEVTSEVPGWTVTYPSMCNGRIADLGFICSTGYGSSEFVHFEYTTGAPYGFGMTKAAKARIMQMRRDFGFTKTLLD